MGCRQRMRRLPNAEWKRRPRLTMRLITLRLPEPWIDAMDDLVRKGFCPNRSEAIRMAIHDLLQKGGK